MVWMHGGAFINGSGSSGIYDGTSFVEAGDVVVVTFNYRLGVLVFLHLAEMDRETYGLSGNCGLLDRIAALQWVNENIISFCVDPYWMSLFGVSECVMCISAMVTMLAA